MLEGLERDQYSSIRESRHSPLQAFLRAGCGFANTRKHFMQFLLRLFWRGIDIFGDVCGPRFFEVMRSSSIE
jgi:hypothetical protein